MLHKAMDEWVSFPLTRRTGHSLQAVLVYKPCRVEIQLWPAPERQVHSFSSSRSEMSFTRTLVFRSYDLGRDSNLILTFDNSKIPGIYKDVFPTAFKYVFTIFTAAYLRHFPPESLLSGRQVGILGHHQRLLSH